MGRPRLSEEERQLIQTIYAENPRRTGKEVREQFLRRNKKPRSVRKIQEVIQPLRGKIPMPTQDPPWNPAISWGCQSAEEMAFLFALDQVSLLLDGAHLTQREAEWTMRLRVLLDEVPRVQALAIVRTYVCRERATLAIGAEHPLTDDLDAYLQWRPWESTDAAYLYEVAAELGLIKALPADELMVEEVSKGPPERDTARFVVDLAKQIYKGAYGDWVEGQLRQLGINVEEFADGLSGEPDAPEHVDPVGAVEWFLRARHLVKSVGLRQMGAQELARALLQLSREIAERRRSYRNKTAETQETP